MASGAYGANAPVLSLIYVDSRALDANGDTWPQAFSYDEEQENGGNGAKGRRKEGQRTIKTCQLPL